MNVGSRGHRWLNKGATPELILEWLSIDGGWCTAASLAKDLSKDIRTVSRALIRLRKRGMVVSRKLQPVLHNSAFEWRAT